MEHLIELILAGLRAAGFRAEWAGPGRVLPRIASPVLAVSMPKMELIKSPNGNDAGATAELRVRVFSPTALGAARCQEVAQKVAIALTQGIQGMPPLQCRVEEASYYGKGDYFTADVFGSFALESDEDGWMMPVGEIALTIGKKEYGRFSLVGVKESREVRPVYAFGEQTTRLQAMGRVQYRITVRRRFPSKMWDRTNLMGMKDFSLELLRGGCLFYFFHCQWEQCAWEDTSEGSEFVGVAVTGNRTVRIPGGTEIHG